MSGVTVALRLVHNGEERMVTELLRVAERHHSDHEIHHGARTLAAWSQRHVERTAKLAADHGLELDDHVEPPGPIMSRMRAVMSAVMGRRPESGILLLEDLQHLYLQAAENSTNWEMLGQLAKAKKNKPMLEVVSASHPYTLRQMRWANTHLKTLSPQILSSL